MTLFFCESTNPRAEPQRGASRPRAAGGFLHRACLWRFSPSPCLTISRSVRLYPVRARCVLPCRVRAFTISHLHSVDRARESRAGASAKRPRLVARSPLLVCRRTPLPLADVAGVCVRTRHGGWPPRRRGGSYSRLIAVRSGRCCSRSCSAAVSPTKRRPPLLPPPDA